MHFWLAEYEEILVDIILVPEYCCYCFGWKMMNKVRDEKGEGNLKFLKDLEAEVLKKSVSYPHQG